MQLQGYRMGATRKMRCDVGRVVKIGNVAARKAKVGLRSSVEENYGC